MVIWKPLVDGKLGNESASKRTHRDPSSNPFHEPVRKGIPTCRHGRDSATDWAWNCLLDFSFSHRERNLCTTPRSHRTSCPETGSQSLLSKESSSFYRQIFLTRRSDTARKGYNDLEQQTIREETLVCQIQRRFSSSQTQKVVFSILL